MRITVHEAAEMLQCSDQMVRMLVQLGKIPGAVCYGPKCRRTYYITEEQVKNFMMKK